jgi:hypothetical protein
VNVYGEIIRLFVAAACALFVLSLPLSKTESGATLRRWAAVCFIFAILPSLITGLFYLPSPPGGTAAAGAAASPDHEFLSSLGCIAAVITAVLVAYGVLKLRSYIAATAKPRDPWDTFFNRGGGKRPFTMTASPRRRRSPFDFGADDGDAEE